MNHHLFKLTQESSHVPIVRGVKQLSAEINSTKIDFQISTFSRRYLKLELKNTVCLRIITLQ